MSDEPFDVVIIGGGPAGLSAALWLGRYHRAVRVFDTGDPRNEPAWAVHGYPGIQDPSPIELRRRLLQQARGEGADRVDGEVVRVRGERDRFSVITAAGDETTARRVILAYGLRDAIPDIAGILPLYGTTVFHCADCDGPSVAGLRIGVLGAGRHGANQALYLSHWSPHITLLTHGDGDALAPHVRDALHRAGIGIRTERVTALTGHGGVLTQAELDGAEPLRLDALFFHLGSEPRCDLAEQLGCDTDEDGNVLTDRGQETTVRGVHAAGDITGPPFLAAIAAADGVRAALAIHRSLLPGTLHVG